MWGSAHFCVRVALQGTDSTGPTQQTSPTSLHRDGCNQDPASASVLTSHKQVITQLKKTNQPLVHPTQVGLQDLWDQHSPAMQKR